MGGKVRLRKISPPTLFLVLAKGNGDYYITRIPSTAKRKTLCWRRLEGVLFEHLGESLGGKGRRGGPGFQEVLMKSVNPMGEDGG